jgi:hypothetical protein
MNDEFNYEAVPPTNDLQIIAKDISKLAKILQYVLACVNKGTPTYGLLEDLDTLIKIEERYK